MGNNLRCCLACILPCGALDVVRIVHLNGQVEEYGRQVLAGEILAAHPNHVISKPCSQGVGRRIMILSRDSELKRGSIYFLIPAASLPEKKRRKKNNKKTISKSLSTEVKVVTDHDSYLAEILSEKKAGYRGGQRSGRVGVWRPHLESIAEDP